MLLTMGVHVDDPVRLGEVRLADGRSLGWAEWGPPDGVPVLLCPGAATSRWLGFGAGVVEAVGVRLVSVDRPGLGVSTPAPGRTLSDFAGDMRRFCALRGLANPAVVANSQGAPFAIACAEAGVASAMAVVSGADEVSAPQFASVLPADLRGLVDRAASDPDGAEEFFAGFTAEAMWNMVIWYGEHDTSHSPDHGALLATRMTTAQRNVVPGIGGALLWTHAEPILTSLLAKADQSPKPVRGLGG